jgi:hypothetical protein
MGAMRLVKPLLTGLAGFSVAGLVLVGSGVGGAAAATASAGQPVATNGAGNGPVLANHPFSIAIYPRGIRHEHVLSANFAVQPGVPVKITVVNYTRRPHTLTVPGLDSSFLIRAGRSGAPVKTSFSFTADKYGVFRWHCALPCGGDMSGYVYAIIGQH